MSQDRNDLDDLQDDQVELSAGQADSSASASSSSASASSSASSGEGANPANALYEELERLKDELAQTKEQVLRTQAEALNMRRRAQQDVEKAHKFGQEKIVSDILPVADNLERAVAAAAAKPDDMQAMIEGVELTLKSLLDALKRHSVERVDPLGEPFNPEFHQAMTTIESRDCEPNTVLDVFQRGYTLHGRLVRPAMVVVAKAPAGKG